MIEYRVQNTEYRPTMCLRPRKRFEIKLLTVCLLSVLAILSTGCRPRGILSSREMRSLLVDLHKTDGMLQVNGWQISNDEVRDIYYAQVLEKHGTTQAQFDSSLVWYTAHPQFFNKIYPKVLKELEAEETAFNELYAEELSAVGRQPAEENRQPSAFSRTDLDSVLWVMQNGYGHSWERWDEPIPTPPLNRGK